MIRTDRLAPSRPMYAFDPESFMPDGARCGRNLSAVWFKRRSGVLTASVGTYHLFMVNGYQEPLMDTYEAWVAAHSDNRYGASCRSRWDGSAFWSSRQDPSVTAADLEFLRGMLDGFPRIPAGWDGWWKF